MPTPSGLVTKQELIDAQLDTAHLGRVVNSKDASGNPINTSMNRTGGVNKTLDALEAEYEQSVRDQFNQFETTFGSQFTYKLIGDISDYEGQSLPEDDKLNAYQYPDDSGAWYAPIQSQAFPITIPTDPTVPGGGWALVNSTSQKWVSDNFSNPNLLADRNPNFLIQTSDESQPLPSATPTSYPPGYQIFSGVFADESLGVTGLTYTNGRPHWTSGNLYLSVPNAGAIANLTSDHLTASVADFDGKPRTRGVSFALVGDEYHVTIGVDALEDVATNETPLASVKFEEGSVATRHSSSTDAGLTDDLVSRASSLTEERRIQSPTGVNVLQDQFFTDSKNPTFPIDFYGDGSSTITLSESEAYAAFDVGVDQVAPDLFRRDYHKYKGLFFTGGENADYGITLRPYTGSQSLFEDLTFMGFGNKDSWCLNFQAQNRWPIIDKFSLSDQGEHINGIKAIDDDTRVIAQGSGNSRVIIDKPRIRYLNGREADTTGIKMAATSAIVHLSAIENASKGLQFHYPSNAAKLQNGYFEQAGSPSGTKSIVIGDDNIVPNNFFFNLYIKDVYSNLHAGNGKFIVMGNASANFRDLVLDGLNIAQTAGQPLIEPNDIPAQSAYVGYVSSGGKTAVLPKEPKSNPVHIVDTYNREWKVINGNGQSSKLSGESKVLPQNAGSILADFWSYVGDISGNYFKRVVTGAERTLLRGATTAVRIASPGAGTYSTITYTIPDISEHAGIDNIIQLFARAEGGTTKTFRVSVKLSTGVTHVLSTTTDDVPQDWTEITVPFFFTNYNDLDDDAIIILEIYGGSLTTQLELTGVRAYEGNTGLCTSNAKSPTEQSMSANPWFYKTKVTIPSGAVNFIVGFDTPVRNLGTITETILLIIDGGSTVAGTLAADGLSASFNVTTGNTAVRTATVSLYHGGS
ncbi:hypothetical protein NVP1118B_96 [Vibrio phage 1.118.B._10N.261.49.F6]|nr:hypothetical protein NVP1118B_96 [Vibrio phage 1.118.B._10N.261.49.F6]